MKCKHGRSITVVGFSPHWHRSSVPWTKRGSRGGKPPLCYYGYHDDDNTLCNGKASKLTEVLHKHEKHQRRVFVCLSCGNKSLQLIQKDSDARPCEYCENLLNQ